MKSDAIAMLALSAAGTNGSLRERLIEATGDAMLSLDEALHVLNVEPKSSFETTEEDLRDCYRILERVMERICD
jgi:hypothetical protein